MKNIFITGSNRGIGLALTDTYLSQGDVHVFGTCRNPDAAKDLQALQKVNPNTLTIIPMDVNDEASLAKAVKMVADETDDLDVLINNAGIFPRTPENVSIGKLEADALNQVLTTNSIAPVMVI